MHYDSHPATSEKHLVRVFGRQVLHTDVAMAGEPAECTHAHAHTLNTKNPVFGAPAKFNVHCDRRELGSHR